MIETGQILNGTYEVISRIGSGGGGIIYKAYHRRMQKYVAIKLIKDNIKGELCNRSEVDMLKNLKNDYLPQVLDFVEEGSDVYTVMEFIEGENFKQIVESGRCFSENKVRKYARQLCAAVEYLHNHVPVIIHSDIKPANVMLTTQDNICLIDFNISMMSENGIAVSKGGSKDFTAPEQFMRVINAPAYVDEFHEETRFIDDDVTEIIYDSNSVVGNSIESKTKNVSKAVIDTRTDIYGLGSTIYYMLTSRVPVAGRPDFRGIHVSTSLKNTIIKAMDPVPARRFKNVGEMRSAFARKGNNSSITVISAAVVLAAGAAVVLVNGNAFREEPLNIQQTSAELSSGEIYETILPLSSEALSETEASETVTENNELIDKYLSYYDFGAIKSETTIVNDDGSYEVTWYEPTGVIDKIVKYDSENVMISMIGYDSFTGENDEESEVLLTEKGISTIKIYENYYVIRYFDLDTHKCCIQEYYDNSDNLIQSFKLDFSYKNDGSYKYIFYNQDGSIYSINNYSADNSMCITEYYKNNKLWYKNTKLLSGEETTDYYDENGSKITETVQTTVHTIQATSATLSVSTEAINSQTAEPKPEWTDTHMNAEMYVTENCYSRERAIIGSTPIRIYQTGEAVKVTSYTNTGYYRIAAGGYISMDYISDTPPHRNSINIRGTVYSTDLTELSLPDMSLSNSDIEPLRFMTNLKKLELHGNNISDISALSGLTSLQELRLSDNQISDLSSLENLKNLKILKVGVNDISDISCLKALTNIKELRMGVNNISDISVLENLNQLEFLDMRGNKVSDVSTIAKLSKLTDFYIYKNPVTDLGSLKDNSSIKTLWIDKYQLNNIAAFSNNSGIEIMILNDIDDDLLSDVRAKLPKCEVKLFYDDHAEIYGY